MKNRVINPKDIKTQSDNTLGEAMYRDRLSTQRFLPALLLLTFAFISSSSFAQNNIVTTEVRPSVQASKIPADMEVQLDGFLNEEVWALAQPITEFRQQ